MKLLKILLLVLFSTSLYAQEYFITPKSISTVDTSKVNKMLDGDFSDIPIQGVEADSVIVTGGFKFLLGDPSAARYGNLKTYMNGIAQGEINANDKGGFQFNTIRSTSLYDGWMEYRFNDGTRKLWLGGDASYIYWHATKSLHIKINADYSTSGAYEVLITATGTTFYDPVTSTQYKLSALNTAPATSTSTGTLGEIRITADYIYICVATNTWKRVALNETTW